MPLGPASGEKSLDVFRPEEIHLVAEFPQAPAVIEDDIARSLGLYEGTVAKC
jgi:hypothetical protein